MKKIKHKLISLLIVLTMSVQAVMPVMAAENDNNKGLISETVFVPLYQEGYFPDSDEAYADLVLYGETPEWVAEFESRVLNAFENNIKIVDLRDLNISKTYENKSMITNKYLSIVNGHPEYFYIAGGFTYWMSSSSYTSLEISYIKEFANVDGTLNETYTDECRNKYETRIAAGLFGISDSMSDVEKVLHIHDFLVRECDYDYDSYLAGSVPKVSHSSYGAMVNNIAVCQGYALAFKDFMNRLGIPCVYVTSSEMSHAWNMVMLDGNWYHVDATWDDPIGTKTNDYIMEGRVSHKYFLKSDFEFTTLNYKGWDSDGITADDSGSYQGYLFRDNSVALNYWDGKWYYKSGISISRGNIDGSGVSVVLNTVMAQYVHSMGENLVIAGYDNNIYRVSMPLLNDLEVVKDFTAEYPGYVIKEFTIKNNQLVSVLYNQNNGAYERIVMDVPFAVDIPTPTPKPTATPSATPTATPSATPTATPSATPSATPTPTAKPTATPTVKPSATSTAKPTATPTVKPSATPTAKPSAAPTASPSATAKPTEKPTATATPTAKPSAAPTATPTTKPTAKPTATPAPGVTPEPMGLVEEFVTRIYKYILEREVDKEGFDYWVDKLRTGGFDGTGVFVGYGFVFSDEFIGKNHTDGEFIDILYRTFMGREADEAGYEYWLENLGGGFSREFVFSSFLNTDEYKNICKNAGIVFGEPLEYGEIKEACEAYRNQNVNISKYVTRCYTKVLGRPFEGEGVEYWCRQIITGACQPVDVAKNFIFSDEFVQKNTTDAEYINVLYEMFFDRKSDKDGLDYWLSMLSDESKTRAQILDDFAYSQEFVGVLAGFGL